MTQNRVSSYEITPYNIRFIVPWQSARGTINRRKGYIIKLTTTNGLSGIGECAPLQDIGTESLKAAHHHLKAVLPCLIGKSIEQIVFQPASAYPAANYALEMSLLDLRAKLKHTSIARLFNPAASNKISVSTVLGKLDDRILSKALQAETEGFKVMKIKMGILSLDEEIIRLKHLLAHLRPGFKIRLDANRAWELGQCRKLLSELKEHQDQIDSLEEPLKIFRESHYRILQRSSTIPLALDESFSPNTHDDLEISQLPVKRLVIKPVTIGSLIDTYRLAKRAEKLGIEIILSSALETGYGLWANANLAAALKNQQVHGVATASWLEHTLVPAPAVADGKIKLES